MKQEEEHYHGDLRFAHRGFGQHPVTLGRVILV